MQLQEDIVRCTPWSALAALVVVYGMARLRPALRRRARRRLHLRAAREAALPHFYPDEALQGIPSERAELISKDAEAAATQVALRERPLATNPHPARTREFVLWEATFHSVMSDFSALKDESPSVESRGPTACADPSAPGKYRSQRGPDPTA